MIILCATTYNGYGSSNHLYILFGMFLLLFLVCFCFCFWFVPGRRSSFSAQSPACFARWIASCVAIYYPMALQSMKTKRANSDNTIDFRKKNSRKFSERPISNYVEYYAEILCIVQNFTTISIWTRRELETLMRRERRFFVWYKWQFFSILTQNSILFLTTDSILIWIWFFEPNSFSIPRLYTS
jgi:hypothetical protein